MYGQSRLHFSINPEKYQSWFTRISKIPGPDIPNMGLNISLPEEELPALHELAAVYN